MKTTGYFVNVYLVDRAYGGPEEGGWWYDCGQAERCIAFSSKARAQRCLARVRRVCDAWNEGRPSVSSVLSQGRYAAEIDCEPAADFPRERPFYE